ncbi:MAG: DUF490 domain-containing protein [Flavobacterium sp. BFFFF2]|nr:MAG: DUF490 domain-containing protein [Flavobacterium sp. BFFFF2]
MFLLTVPAVQTRLGRYVTDEFNNAFKTHLTIDQVAISVFGTVKLKEVFIRDHHQDTLIYAHDIRTSILDWKRLIKGQLFFGPIQANGLELHIKRYKGEETTNIDRFVQAIDDGKPGKGRFRMYSKKVTVTDGRFRMLDDNRKVPKDVDFTKLNIQLDDFKIKGPRIFAQIDEMAFHDHRGVDVERLRGYFVYTKQSMTLSDMTLKTTKSFVKGKAKLTYQPGDFADFNNRVKFDVQVDFGSVASHDIHCFFKGIGKNLRFLFRSRIEGTLNNLYCIDLSLKDTHQTKVVGDVNFRNLFNNSPGEFYMNGKFQQVTATYSDLIAILPQILKNKLPSSIAKLGRFSLVGRTKLTKYYIDTDFYLSTLLGNLEAQLNITSLNHIDKAAYQGNLNFDHFQVGQFANLDNVGALSADLHVKGKGFKQAFLDTDFDGTISLLEYNGYAYSQLKVDGGCQQSVFSGKVNSNDPNLRMDFDGSVDFNKQVKKFDFEAQVDYANLKKLHFIKDSIGVFRGNLRCLVDGTKLDDIIGNLDLKDASYQNRKDLYFFDQLHLNASFDEQGERTILIQSPDIVKGKVVGKFRFADLRKLAENCMGSLYTNYKPNPVQNGQYVNFDIQLFSKFVEIFYPDITIAPQTVVRGKLSSETKNFRLNVSSPYITAFQTTMDKVQLEIDNKNPMYAAYIQMDSIKTKYYKIRDFSLINTSKKDTLLFRTEFRGGLKGQDFYNINLYHTIDANKNNVVGFQKSELQFKDHLWYLNEQNDEKNRVVFDKKLKDFNFDAVTLSHDDQKISLFGFLSGNDEKDMELLFDQVDLSKITPDVKQFTFEGVVDGFVKVKQKAGQYQPTALLAIDRLKVNAIDLGRLSLDIKGDDNFRNFNIDANLHNQNIDSFTADGTFNLIGQQSILDLDVYFNRFNLGILNKLGGDVIHNIRGFATGTAKIDGDLNQLDYNGRLTVSEAGLQIPYLNTDYRFEDETIVDISKNRFLVRDTPIYDTKFNTMGNLSGSVTHKDFSDWALNLGINSPRLLMLNTTFHEGAAYFGKAFIKGDASISGPVSGLLIKMKATSEKGTDIKIPIVDAQATGDNGYIHFKTPAEKKKEKEKSRLIERNYNGLELDFDFDILENADIEVILNQETKHGMKGNGRGTLQFKINTLGKFEMTGDYQVYKGVYNFSYGNLINKRFDVKKFGSIVWEGDPMKATLNLEAIYKTQANPAVLIDNASFNRKVNVEVVIGVRGTLSNPEPDFAINFPNVSSVLRSEIQTRLDDKDMRQTQAISLLSTGSFLSPEGIDQTQFVNNLYERAGNLLKDLFQDQNGKMQLGFDYSQAEKSINNVQNAGRFGVTVTSQINERVTINGKVGVPVGGINESAIVGNVELLYRVNEDGTLNLRVFNRENDINYIGQGIGYTQGVGLTYEVDFNTFKELVNRIFKKARLDTEQKPVVPIDDNSYLPENVQMKEKGEKDPPKKEKQPEVPPAEALIEE